MRPRRRASSSRPSSALDPRRFVQVLARASFARRARSSRAARASRRAARASRDARRVVRRLGVGSRVVAARARASPRARRARGSRAVDRARIAKRAARDGISWTSRRVFMRASSEPVIASTRALMRRERGTRAKKRGDDARRVARARRRRIARGARTRRASTRDASDDSDG